jgi:uncharacterized membrane protein YbhN (UPF0104 family)
MRRRWSWLVGAAVLTAVVGVVGAAPFVTGIRSLDPGTLVVGVLLGLPVTVASAWRWRLVSRGLGVELPLGRATAAYYRSQLLNCVLPGGVLGDVARGVDHGLAAGDAARGLRSVAWERTVGQVVSATVAVLLLLALPSPVRSSLPAVLGVVLAGVTLLVLLGRVWPTLRADLAGLLAQRVWPGVVACSAVAVAGHVATYVVAARAAGVSAPLATVLPLTMLVLLAAAIPANLAGWGPREGMAAWAFGAAGLGAAQGVAATVAFGVLVLAAALPGAVVLLADLVRAEVRPAQPAEGSRSRA